MSVQKIGRQRMRDLIAALDIGLGFGTNSAADGDAFTQLGDNGETSYWKSGADVTVTKSEPALDPLASEVNPWVQFEAVFDDADAVDTLHEMAASVGITAHGDQGGNELVTRKKIGGAGGIVKANDYSLLHRVTIFVEPA